MTLDPTRETKSRCPSCQASVSGWPGYGTCCPSCKVYFEMPRTNAQEFIVKELGRMLDEGARYRVGVLILSYEDEAGESRVAHGMAMRDESPACVLDMVKMVRRFRELADELERLSALPTQEAKP